MRCVVGRPWGWQRGGGDIFQHTQNRSWFVGFYQEPIDDKGGMDRNGIYLYVFILMLYQR